MPDQPAFAIPCNLIITANTREEASQTALIILRETISLRVFDIENDIDTEYIGFDHDEETITVPD